MSLREHTGAGALVQRVEPDHHDVPRVVDERARWLMLFAEAFCVLERPTAAVDAATASTAAATAMMRTFIDEPPRGVDDGPLRPLLWPW